MPSSSEILELTSLAAREQVWLAIAWHVAAVAALVALLAGWRPSARVAVLLLGLPAVSVAAIAISYGNPFNAVSFGLLAGLLAAAPGLVGDRPVARGSILSASVGFVLIGFGLIYPHFVEGPWYRALWAAPAGVIPCPTLAILAGFTLLAGGFATRAIPAALAVWTAFYAVFGIARLGVTLDLGLVLAAVALAGVAVENTRARALRPATA